MEKIFILTQMGQGVIEYSKNKSVIEERYAEESGNGRFAGFEVKEVNIPAGMFNNNRADFFRYLRGL